MSILYIQTYFIGSSPRRFSESVRILTERHSAVPNVTRRSQASLVNIVLSVSTRLKPSFLFCHQETVNKKKEKKMKEKYICHHDISSQHEFGQYYLFGCQVSLEKQIKNYGIPFT